MIAACNNGSRILDELNMALSRACRHSCLERAQMRTIGQVPQIETIAYVVQGKELLLSTDSSISTVA